METLPGNWEFGLGKCGGDLVNWWGRIRPRSAHTTVRQDLCAAPAGDRVVQAVCLLRGRRRGNTFV